MYALSRGGGVACGYPGIHAPSIEVAVVLKVMIGLGGLRCEVHSTEHDEKCRRRHHFRCRYGWWYAWVRGHCG
jgi:hypothetical protein